MSQTKVTQREWLLEDIEQIRRYFPGAKLVETVDTPFDISVHPTPTQYRRTKNSSNPVPERYERTTRAPAEKAASGVRAVHEFQRYEHPKRSKLLLKNDCVSWGILP